MEVRFEDAALDDLETNVGARPKLPIGVIKAFRKRLWQIRAAHDEREFYAIRGFNFEKYHSAAGHFVIRLNAQFRLILRFEQQSGERTVVIVAIKDYH